MNEKIQYTLFKTKKVEVIEEHIEGNPTNFIVRKLNDSATTSYSSKELENLLLSLIE